MGIRIAIALVLFLLATRQTIHTLNPHRAKSEDEPVMSWWPSILWLLWALASVWLATGMAGTE